MLAILLMGLLFPNIMILNFQMKRFLKVYMCLHIQHEENVSLKYVTLNIISSNEIKTKLFYN